MASISIVVPVYNAEDYIVETLRSLQQQTITDWQAVVVDDGSTDRSASRIAELADPRIRLVRQANRGVAAARNLGIESSDGNWIAFIDADDLWAPNKLESQLATARRENADVVFGPVQLFGEAHRQRAYEQDVYVLEGDPGVACMISRNRVPQSSVLATRASLQSVGGYDESLQLSEDYDLWLRMLLAGAKFVYDPRAMTQYRIVANSHSSRKVNMRAGMRKTLARAAMPSWPLHIRCQVKLWELCFSQWRHQRARRQTSKAA